MVDMEAPVRGRLTGQDLTEREIRVLEAVVRAYVETAEPAGSRTVARRCGLGVSPATIRNTMSDLEEKGYLTHPHTSAGRVPTDRAYRFHVDQLIRMPSLSREEQTQLVRELDAGGTTTVERLIRRAARALSVVSLELGVGLGPRVDEAVLERL
ncbi:MAG: LexA family protein, partial [Longimicrobiales bacterium]